MPSSISDMLNSRMRIVGMASGLDVDSMVQSLMKVERMKVDKIIQKRTLLEWKRDNYREITSQLQGLSSEYFDIIRPSTNIRSSAAFNSFVTTYDGSETSSVLTATGGSGATPGSYTVSNVVTAKVATAEGTANLAAGITGSSISSLGINSTADNNKITVTFNGVSKEITVADNPATLADLKSDLQAKLDSAFGKYSDNTSKIVVGLTGAGSDQLSFSTSSTNTLSFSNAYNTGLTTVLGKDLSSGITLDNQNNKFKLTLDGITNDIVLSTGTYADADAVLAEVQSKIDAVPDFSGKVRALNQNGSIVLKAIGTAGSATGALASADISGGATIDASNKSLDITLDGTTKTITLDEKTYTRDELISAIQTQIDSQFGANKGMVGMDGSNQLRFESISSTSTLSAASKENDGLAALGLTNANTSNKIDTTADILSIKDNFSTPFIPGTADASGNDIEFTINGEVFKFNSSATSLNDIVYTVNSNADAGVTMKYDELNDKFLVESKDTGATAKVEITEQNGNIMGVLGLVQNASGTDASIDLDGQTIVRSTNNFTVNGIAFDLKTDSAGPISLNVNADPEKTIELIKGFVKKYNEVLDKINGELTEERHRSYLPLTDEQRQAMKDDDVKRWEEAAKSGLLRSDSLLSSVVSDMRKALSDSIEGVSVSLSSIGIKTGSYSDKGKLYIDEEKLKASITENPNEVIQLFTKESQYSYKDALDDSTKKTTRYNESGLGHRLYDIIQDNIRTIRDNSGRKGKLLEKAGMAGDLSEVSNLLNKQIRDYSDSIDALNAKLYDKENRYYAKFTTLERVLSQMNSQSGWLSAQLGQQ